MRHQLGIKKLSRPKSHRDLMISNQVASLVRNEYITTTVPKAKVTKSAFDRMINIAKRAGGNAHRSLRKYMQDGVAVDKIVEVLADRYKDLSGGYTKVNRVGFRKGDNAPLMRIKILPAEKVQKENTDKSKIKKNAK